VVFSGDTGPIENLTELAQGSDVLVHEVIAREWVERLLPPPRNDAQEARTCGCQIVGARHATC
jgi:hypothetical protein